MILYHKPRGIYIFKGIDEDGHPIGLTYLGDRRPSMIDPNYGWLWTGDDDRELIASGSCVPVLPEEFLR